MTEIRPLRTLLKLWATIFPDRFSLRRTYAIQNDGEAKAGWLSLKVGDKLIANSDVYLKTHRKWYNFYPCHRQFTAGKAYPIVQVRPRTDVVFVMDDGRFRVDLNPFQGRKFTIEHHGGELISR